MTARFLEHVLPGAGDKVFAFSTTRHGGCGSGAYATLNCTPYVGDDPATVERNLDLLLGSFPQRPRQLLMPQQTHGIGLAHVDEAFLALSPDMRHGLLQGIDALVTGVPGVCVAVSTADCIPVLLADVTHGAVAAVHAGWRGTLAGVVPHTLQAMTRLYGTRPAEDLAACIGPGISAAAFEVGQEVADLFAGAGFPMADIAYTDASTGKPHIDLPAANRLQLLGSGLSPERICISGLCTYTRCDDFFSARRLGIKSGRMLSGIMWR